MSVDLQLISKIIRTGDITKALEWGISSEDLLTPEGNGMFRHLLGYFLARDTQGAIIGPNAMRQHYPNFQLCDDPSMSVEALCFEVRRNRLVKEGEGVAEELAQIIQADPMKGLVLARERIDRAISLGAAKNGDIFFADEVDRVIADYENAELGLHWAKVHWPWAEVNDITGGLSEDDYIVLYGRPKNFKTWILSYMIACIYMQPCVVLVYTKEMTALNLTKRIAACLCRLPYQELRSGRLDMDQKMALQMLRDMKDVERDLLVGGLRQQLIILSDKDAPPGGGSIPWIRSKIEKYKPDVVFIDGLYLLKTEQSGSGKSQPDWLRVQTVSRAARDLVLETKIPLVATMQANRKAAGHSNAELDEIAYADAIGQDATFALRVIKEKNNPTALLVTAGSREFDLPGVRINAVPAQDFSYHSVLTEKEIQRAKDADVSDEGVAAASKHSRPRVREETEAEKVEQRIKREQMDSGNISRIIQQ